MKKFFIFVFLIFGQLTMASEGTICNDQTVLAQRILKNSNALIPGTTNLITPIPRPHLVLRVWMARALKNECGLALPPRAGKMLDGWIENELTVYDQAHGNYIDVVQNFSPSEIAEYILENAKSE